MKIGNREFRERTYIMGILNVTPDSFSDGGRHNSLDGALWHAEKMLDEGADIIDVGGESTRPGYIAVSDDEEISRTAPVIEKIKQSFDIPVSIDTYKHSVAEAALSAGADMINDIWGFKYDGKMAETAAKHNVPCCLMHNRKEAVYSDFLNDVFSDLSESIKTAEEHGIDRANIIIDPGVGFAKSYEQNIEIIRNMHILDKLGCPLLLGASRKSVIGLTLGLPVEERLEGTLALSVIAALKGALFVRVHDIKENKRAVTMAEKIIGRW